MSRQSIKDEQESFDEPTPLNFDDAVELFETHAFNKCQVMLGRRDLKTWHLAIKVLKEK